MHVRPLFGAPRGRIAARGPQRGPAARRRRAWRIAWCGALCSVALSGTASAQAPLTQRFTDHQGRFTIAFPEDWTVVATQAGDTEVTGFAPDNRRSRGQIPVQTGGALTVSVDHLPVAMSVRDYGQRASRGMASTFATVGFKLLQEGPARLSDRDAYFQYFTTTNLYQLQTYVIVGRRLFVINGSCPNDPAITRHDVPEFVRITNSFRAR